MSQPVTDRLRGRRVVTTVYVAVVALAGVFGAAIGVLLPAENGRDIQEAAFAGIEFAVTPFNFALYGVLMVGVTLGVLLVGVSLVSRYDDDAVEKQ
ncbi:DUF7520 family protein [Haloarchaeobius sp. HRN-SO-5]|uniref:DUF7520 family protein n=1 Tax=Haloarchaeobius sp. HRN-SO-5 TaxID=3446118 RepID=UPI003EB73638